jgi:hypothetical protein
MPAALWLIRKAFNLPFDNRESTVGAVFAHTKALNSPLIKEDKALILIRLINVNSKFILKLYLMVTLHFIIVYQMLLRF